MAQTDGDGKRQDPILQEYPTVAPDHLGFCPSHPTEMKPNEPDFF